jgi:hypothetical protein
MQNVFSCSYPGSCTAVPIVGTIREEVDVSATDIQHIIHKTFNATPHCYWLWVGGRNLRRL